MRTYMLLCVLLCSLAACTKQAAGPDSIETNLPHPSQVIVTDAQATLPFAPQGDFFYSLPNYDVGQTVTLDGYTARLDSVDFSNNKLDIDLKVVNDSGRPIDMVWAVQLMKEDSGYIAPEHSPVKGSLVGETYLADNDELGGVWSYDLGSKLKGADDLSAQPAIDLNDYRLLFLPFGWSGPVFVFRLDSTTG